jgi:hypothetical protein
LVLVKVILPLSAIFAISASSAIVIVLAAIADAVIELAAIEAALRVNALVLYGNIEGASP